MRFLAEGPSIPDELLISRDEGRVIFFCGSGISYARAGLSDFFGLARQVVEALGVTTNDPVRKIIDAAGKLERRTGIPGLISADRIFGLLERDFRTEDIEESVAKILKPSPDADLSAHQIMLDLSRTPVGKIRLVTTNFDLLFEACDSSLPRHRYPRLPDPNRHEEFEGIIHLHGYVDNDYQGASGDGFVLSSSEFGDAYLADGWATQFIRSILEKYVVVFVGYAADDPPVHYLLEALNKRSNSLQKMYAFQVGTQNDAEARWRHKGVVPIAYDDSEGHKLLWETLAAWSDRAVNPDAWYEKIIDMARKGPVELQPHERGQVAHLVSSPEGAGKFASSKNPLPAEWLCVFDPAIRYLKPGRLDSYSGPFFDPFEAYGLECDPVPPKIDPEDFYAKRDIPPDAWNCFSPTSRDLQNLEISNYAGLRGHYSVNVPALPARLSHLGHWICMVSVKPAAVWWASQQVGLHPVVQERILHEIESSSFPQVRRAWRHIFAAWKTSKKDSYHEWFRLKAVIDLDGWSSTVVVEFARIYRPYLTATRPFHGGPKPPIAQDGISINDMVSLDVQYPKLDERINIPDKHLVDAVREFRKNLELSINLEKELGGFEYLSLPPIESDPGLEGESSDRDYGISRLFFKFFGFFRRLTVLDPTSAKKEYKAWWDDDNKVFARLRIWVTGHKDILSNSEAGQVISDLNDEVFWDSRHQRDLMLVLKRRWRDFPVVTRKKLEKRLLRGRLRWEGEEKAEFEKRRAWQSLDRIHWLNNNGCSFSCDILAVSAKLQKLSPEWQLRYAAKAAASLEGHGGTVRTDTEFAALLIEPLGSLLTKSRELSGRTSGYTEKDPFAGLAAERPIRAFSSLNIYAKRGEWPEWAWSKFLFSPSRGKDKPRFTALIASRMADLPTNAIAGFIYPAADWLFKTSEILFASYPEKFERVWSKLVEVLKSESEISKTALVRGSKVPDWATEALNAPVGKLAQAIMNDPQKKGLKARKGFPAPWSTHVEELLGLAGDHRRYALVMFAFNLNWFFYIDPVWTDKNLLSVLNDEDEDQEAFWDGFFWGVKYPEEKLFLRLKPWLLLIPLQERVVGRREVDVLSAILLAGWARACKKTTKHLVTNDEMRNVLLNADDDFRVQIIWHLERWSSDKKDGAWKANLSGFFTEVWPRQKQAKSPKMSAKLCDMAFSNEDIFPVVADIILPLLTKIDEEGFILPHLRGTKNGIVEKYPEKTLALLWAVLPKNATRWPYGIGDVLPKIGEAEPSLLNDSRLVELKRRWNTR